SAKKTPYHRRSGANQRAPGRCTADSDLPDRNPAGKDRAARYPASSFLLLSFRLPGSGAPEPAGLPACGQPGAVGHSPDFASTLPSLYYVSADYGARPRLDRDGNLLGDGNPQGAGSPGGAARSRPEAAQARDELLPVGRADAGHVVVSRERDLAGVSGHRRALVVEDAQRDDAARVGPARGTAPPYGAGAGQRQCVVEGAGPGQLVERRVDEPERLRLPLLGGGDHAGHQRRGQAGPADVEL